VSLCSIKSILPGGPTEIGMIRPMARLRKITLRLFLVLGLLSILTALRNLYAPGLFNISHLSNADRAGLAPLQLVTGVLWLLAGFGGLFKIRRNPEGKEEPVVKTIFGPQ
jgi:hypothetical protein